MKGIYAYYDLQNNYYVYVGKDNNITYNHRHHCHKSPAYYNDQPFNRILQNNPRRYEYQRIIELDDSTEEYYLNDLESYFIKLFQTYAYENRDKHVFNFTKGGDGSIGYKHTKETREKMRKNNQLFKKGNIPHNKGLKKTDEEKLNDVVSQYNRLNSADDKPNSNIFRVSIKKCPKCKNGINYVYRYPIGEGKRKEISSTKGLDDLKEKVLKQNQVWWEFT